MLKQSGRSRPASLAYQSETGSSALGSRTSTAATSPASTASVSDAANPASFTGALSDKDAVRRGFDPSIPVTSWRPDCSCNLTEVEHKPQRLPLSQQERRRDITPLSSPGLPSIRRAWQAHSFARDV